MVGPPPPCHRCARSARRGAGGSTTTGRSDRGSVSPAPLTSDVARPPAPRLLAIGLRHRRRRSRRDGQRGLVFFPPRTRTPFVRERSSDGRCSPTGGG